MIHEEKKMPLVEITHEEQSTLYLHRFEKLVASRAKILGDISVIEKFQAFAASTEIQGVLLKELDIQERKLSAVEEGLKILRQKLGIETPTIHTEL